MKPLCMIPARIGSKRIPRKNLRMLGGKPLIAHVIEKAVSAQCFSRVVVNADDQIFREIAEKYGADFYLRPEALGSDSTNNDEFLLDFLNVHECELCVQLLPTSPLITEQELKSFADEMQSDRFDTLVSVVPHKIAAIHKGKPVNFQTDEPHIPSQEMEPVCTYATVLMGWRKADFIANMSQFGFGYHGVRGRIGYFEIAGLSTIDIDNEHDFQMAEVALRFRDDSRSFPELFYGDA